MKWKILFLSLFLPGMALAGTNDRFSNVNLTDDDLVEIPEISAPSGNPGTNKGWVYLKDAGSYPIPYYEDDQGNVYELMLENSSGDVTVSNDLSVGGALGVTGAATLTSVVGTGVISATNIADVVREIQLPLNAFMIETGGDGSTVGTGLTPLSSSTSPALEIDDNVGAMVWPDGKTSPNQVTFQIPSNYVSGGAFLLIATESDSTTPNQVDFDVYINTDGTASDSSATGQTPVALAGTTTTPDQVTLTPATDQASFAAGSWVTFRLWRDDVATGTGDLEVKGVAFQYTASQ